MKSYNFNLINTKKRLCYKYVCSKHENLTKDYERDKYKDG